MPVFYVLRGLDHVCMLSIYYSRDLYDTTALVHMYDMYGMYDMYYMYGMCDMAVAALAQHLTTVNTGIRTFTPWFVRFVKRSPPTCFSVFYAPPRATYYLVHATCLSVDFINNCGIHN